MLPGFGGQLVSECFLESHLAAPGDAFDDAEADRVRRQLASWRRRGRALGPASSLRSVFEVSAAPLVETLGFDSPRSVEQGRHTCAVCTVAGGPQAVTLVVAAWGQRLDPLWRVAVAHAIRHGSAWCLLYNGTHLRVVDARRPYARRFAEFDVDLAIEDDRAFAAFWWLMRANRFAPAGSRVAIAPFGAVVDASDRQAAGVCRSLRHGVLAASTEILTALVHGAGRAVSPAESFEQALTIVYRLLFLFFAEARGLVPLWHPLYRESYSVESLHDAAERDESGAGLWDAMRAIAKLAHAGCHAGDLRVAPFNGRLFAPSRTPLADGRHLDDGRARRAVLALSTRAARGGAGRERIAYRDLGVEQLGAVYETLLDYEPRVEASRAPRRGRSASAVTLEPGSGIRKATGTFYTPEPIADYLVRRTLAPLVRGREPEQILALRVVDPAMGSGAFLVAACRFLAAAYESALVERGGCHATDLGEAERALIRRTIAERCLYGVDLNPMAVQLARLSLWLATLAADRPLTFLDHRLLAGDSLLGAWLSVLGRSPAVGTRSMRVDRSAPRLFDDADPRSALRDALPVRFTLESAPGDTLEQVRAKERALASLGRPDHPLSKWKRVADLWCAAWFPTPSHQVPSSAFGALSDRILTGRGPLPSATAEDLLRGAAETAAERRFFHWELEFPEAFFAADGTRRPRAGFDAVIGNPPWDMIRADAGSADRRSRARTDLARVLRFTRDSGIYSAQSGGHANRYQLFLERAMALTRPGGRVGLVLPWGLAVDHGSARLRSRLLAGFDVDSLVGFDNRRGVFPIHRSVRFLLLTATGGASTRAIGCRLDVRDPAELSAIGDGDAGADASFPLRITPALLARISGDDLTVPNLRGPMDVAIVERAASLFPPFGSEQGWAARFGRELNATDDRRHFRPGAAVPVVEGKQIEPFRVNLAASRSSIADADARRLLGSPRHERPRLGYRDVASATNRLTLIAAILPAGCVSTHTVFCLRTPLPLVAQSFLCGVFNSFVANYLVRLRVATHVTTAVIARLPVPRRDDAPRAFREIAALARRLMRRPDPVAAACLQARVATLYQLTAGEFEHVLGTFPLVPREERDAALRCFTNGTTEAPRSGAK